MWAEAPSCMAIVMSNASAASQNGSLDGSATDRPRQGFGRTNAARKCLSVQMTRLR